MDPIYEDVIERLKQVKSPDKATVVFLHGDLGAGKTTFIKNLYGHLGLVADVTSPTFTILKKYPFAVFGFENLIHIDAYRLKGYEDLRKIKFEEYLADEKNLICIEWPSVVADGGLKADMNISFEHVSTDERLIKLL